MHIATFATPEPNTYSTYGSHNLYSCQVKVTLKGLVEGRTFDERTLEWELGEGLELNLPRGLELAVEKLKVSPVGEVCRK